ncbi:MAG TPA: sigma-70 family RNA polymerase sigma factor [Vicinamibacterales bacterium]
MVDRSPLPVAHSADSTTTLLERARAGDRDAVDALVARCWPPMLRWAKGRLPPWARDLADTQDVVQEAVVQTFKHLDRIEARGEGALQAYLRQAVLNRIRDHIRRVGRRPAATTLDSQHVDPAPSPLEHAVGREALECYEAALARLSDADRELIVASVELGYTNEQLAESTGRASPDAARRAAKRALVKLAEEMESG